MSKAELEILQTIQDRINKAYADGERAGFATGLRKKFQQSQEDIVDLIMEALLQLGHHICPHCERGIGMEDYLTKEDIEKWLKERK